MNHSEKSDCYSDHPDVQSNNPPGQPDSRHCLDNLKDGNEIGAVRGIGAKNNYIMGDYAVALGLSTAAPGRQSVAEGEQTIASGCNSHAEGFRTAATAQFAHVEGYDSFATGGASHAENCGNTASGTCSHAEGAGSTASGEGTHAEGASTASQIFSHSEGFRTESAGVASHAEGNEAKCTGYCAHAEGRASAASGEASHAEGTRTQALSEGSHAEGCKTSVSARGAHAEGISSNASGEGAHAQGFRTVASGSYSLAEGYETSTNGFPGAHVMGRYGSADTDFSWFLANGADAENTGLAAKILNQGAAYIDHAWNGGGTGFAAFFETANGKEIEPGLFVTFAGPTDKIRIAETRDHYLLGVVSVEAAFVCNSGELRWNGKYETDEWGRVLYEEVTVPAVTEQEGRVVCPEHREMRPVINPAWDPAQRYIPRSARCEWVTVMLVGTVRARDNGMCVPGGFCLAGPGGIAVPTPRGHRVLKRTGSRQIQILMR